MDIEEKIQRYLNELRLLKSNSHLRELKEVKQLGSSKVSWQGKEYLNLSSNDYLGLSTDKSLQQEFLEAVTKDFDLPLHGFGGSSSRLLTGNSPAYLALESLLTSLYRSEAALVFNSGYHANIGILPALAGPEDLIISDELIHASLIDGIRLCKSEKRRFAHLDYEGLEEILKKERAKFRQVFIVAESIYSMNGDSSDVGRLVEIKNRYNALLYLDEAHGVGVFGKKGLGLAEEKGCLEEIDLLIGTFGKALASQGAFLISKAVIQNFLINKMRSLIFTTALPSLSLSWTKFILERIPNLDYKRERLVQLSEQLRVSLKKYPGPANSNSQIIPLICGDNDSTQHLAHHLQSKGVLAFPIRTPTVPQGTARIRFSLTADMEFIDLDNISNLVDDFYKKIKKPVE